MRCGCPPLFHIKSIDIVYIGRRRRNQEGSGGGRGSREIFIGRAEPQVDGALDASGAEGEADLHAHPGRAIAGQENFPDDPAVLAGGDRGLLAVGTAGEVVHFLGGSRSSRAPRRRGKTSPWWSVPF